MARLITLSRAARLVGVKRATLQNQIRAGDLNTFEGQLDLTELLRVYPQTKVEDSTMIERADRHIERALSRVVRDTDQLPDAEVLASRVAAFSHELGMVNHRMRRYDVLMQQLQDYLRKLAVTHTHAAADLNELREWLETGLDLLNKAPEDDNDLYATDMLLRVMAAQVHLEPSGHEFFVQGNDNLLDSGLRAGLALDYGCTDGSCGRCMAKLRGGTVKPVRRQRLKLSETERAQGQLLMCCHTAVTDVTLEAVETPHPAQLEARDIESRIGAVERVEEDLIVLSLRPTGAARLRFFAGQSARLGLHDAQADYPIASCPCDETQLEFHIRAAQDDKLARLLFAGVGFDMTLSVHGPQGDFVLDDGSLNSIIFIAWDTGFAPIKSLIEHAMALDAAEHLHLYWIHTEGERPYLHNRCRAWADALENFHYVHLPAAPEVSGSSIDAREQQATLFAAIAEPHFDIAMFDVYIAAPEEIVLQCRRYLAARGVPAAQVRSWVVAT